MGYKLKPVEGIQISPRAPRGIYREMIEKFLAGNDKAAEVVDESRKPFNLVIGLRNAAKSGSFPVHVTQKKGRVYLLRSED